MADMDPGIAPSDFKGKETSTTTRSQLLTWLDETFQVRPDGKQARPEVMAAYFYPNSQKIDEAFEIELRYHTDQFARSLHITAKFDPETKVSVGGATYVLRMGASETIPTQDILDSLWRNVQDFTWLGVEHLFTGFDHVLFICTLVFASLRPWNAIKLLTAFTVGHALTLVLTTYDVFQVPPRLVDIGVAATIFFVAGQNIVAKEEPYYRWLLVLGFSLIHGMGFSASLCEMGLPSQGLGLCLFAFNIGIELAQIAIVLLIFPVLTRIQWAKVLLRGERGAREIQRLLVAGNGFTAAMGLYWFGTRLIGAE